jgi:DNA-binding beta-propeller fold protein YncE
MVKRCLIVLVVIGLGVVNHAQRGAPSPEQQAALAKQDALEKATARLQITEDVLPLVVPGHTIGEAVGVSKNSQGHVFVFTRSGNVGPAKGATASQLFEFDQTLKFVKQWGQDNYAASFAHTVRVDKHDNVWMTDEGANMIVKFNPQGMVSMVLGRKTEAIDYLERFTERGEKEEVRYPAGNPGTFNRPTDVTWDPQENIFVSDGYNNSRVVKIAKDGKWVKSVGTRGSGPNQFNTPHAITSDAKGNIYVADRGNRRIQVFDTDGNFKHFLFLNAPYDKKHHPTLAAVPANAPDESAPWAMCLSNGPTQYLFVVDSEPGRLYKMTLDGKIVGMLGISGHEMGQFNWPHGLACQNENTVYVADMNNWRVQKILIKGGATATR